VQLFKTPDRIGKVFYIVETVKIPIGNEADWQVIIEDDVIMKVARTVSVLIDGNQW